MRWLLLILLFPMMELSIFVDVSDTIGVGWVVALTLFSAVSGIALVKRQGISTLQRFQQKLAQKEPPGVELVEGFLLMLAGILLLIPGFIGDSVGALLLVPPIRALLSQQFFKGSMSPIKTNPVVEEQNEQIHTGRIIDQKEPWE